MSGTSTPSSPPDIRPLQRLLRAGDGAGLAAALAGCCGPDPRLPALVDYALTGVLPAGGIPARGPLDAALLAQMAGLHRRVAPEPVSHRVVPAALDSLANDPGPAGWTAVQWLNMLLLREIVPRRRAAALVCMRDDGLSIVEWVAHYRALGFDAIYVYSNDNVDGSDALLVRLAELGEIVYLENRVDPNFSPQRKAYAHALQLVPDLRDFEWAFFLDSDEFFMPGPHNGPRIGDVIAELDARFPRNAPSAICFQWRWYVSGWRYTWEDRLLLRRFRHANDHRLSKSLVRTRDVLSMRRLHFPDLVDGAYLVRPDLSRLEPAAFWESRPPDYQRGQINHYWVKSFEEFSIKKARGDTLVMTNNDFARSFELFFDWNGRERASGLAPPAAGMLALVEREQMRIMAQPGVAECVHAIQARLPALLARFDAAGGLRRIYDTHMAKRA